MRKTDNTPDLFLKHPTSKFLNSAIYFRYSFRAKAVTVMVFGTYLLEIKNRLLQMFPQESPAPMQGKDDPFVVLSAIMAEYSSMMEYERRTLDFSVRDQESKTGATAHIYDESLRVQAAEYGDLVRALHVIDGLVMIFQRTLDYQVGLLKFLEEQHGQFQTLSLSYSENAERNPMTLRVGDSLRQSLSLATHRLEQVKTLDRRIQIQIGVVGLFLFVEKCHEAHSIAGTEPHISERQPSQYPCCNAKCQHSHGHQKGQYRDEDNSRHYYGLSPRNICCSELPNDPSIFAY